MSRKWTLLALGLGFVSLVAHRVWRYAEAPSMGGESWMAAQLGEADERDIHLTPRGKYTLADIEANGRVVPSQKYRRFQARHDFNPKTGERLCPVTRTQASADCAWTIGGNVYHFCCPPCIDEFVRLAKETPSKIQPPESYVKR